ncbi:MAG: low molecular weight phosphotyrosine protein phosphatase [Clostridia bacterium]|nr:low molecular weight phosphotyrosine protein phosphatase [Clostridia bacterium]
MIKILFVCHGNICRSAAAEMVMKMLVESQNMGRQIHVESAAATTEEIGHDIYPPMKRTLLAHGVPCTRHAARQIQRGWYHSFDQIIGMDRENMDDMAWFFHGDPEGKCSLLLDHAGRYGEEVSDPWYTRDFERAYQDVLQGCEGLLHEICDGCHSET